MILQRASILQCAMLPSISQSYKRLSKEIEAEKVSISESVDCLNLPPQSFFIFLAANRRS